MTDDNSGDPLARGDRVMLEGLIKLLENRSLTYLDKFISSSIIPSLIAGNRGKVINICNIMLSGLRGFDAKGGPLKSSGYSAPSSAQSSPSSAQSAPPTSTSAKGPSEEQNKHSGNKRIHSGFSKHRNKKLRGECATRDTICVLGNQELSVMGVAHIIPFSLRVDPGTSYSAVTQNGRVRETCANFWNFLGMLLGSEEAQCMVDQFGSLETLENLILLGAEAHSNLDYGRLTLTPDLTAEQERSYDPYITSEARSKTVLKDHLTN